MGGFRFKQAETRGHGDFTKTQRNKSGVNAEPGLQAKSDTAK